MFLIWVQVKFLQMTIQNPLRNLQSNHDLLQKKLLITLYDALLQTCMAICEESLIVTTT